MIGILRNVQIIPVIEIESLDAAVPATEALKQGGLSVIEITLRTDTALAALQKIATSMPDVIVGAGTVTTINQAKQAVDSGAKFLVSPGFSSEIVRYCTDHHISILPGIVTPTELMMGLEFGLQVYKFFPAETMGGVKTLRSLSGPFPQIKFVPTGGINLSNMNTFLHEKYVLAVGGSWMATKAMIATKDWSQITQTTLKSIQISQNTSPPQV